MATLLKVLRTTERVFLVTIFLMMVGLFTLGVVVREVAPQYSSDFSWIEEAVQTLNLFLVFCALGLALERKRHVGVTTFRDSMPLPVRRFVFGLIDISGVLFSIYTTRLGIEMVQFVFASGQRSPTLNIAMGWIYLAPTIGFVLLGLRYALSLFGVIDRFTPDTANTPTTSEKGAA
ncbi:C4-dicarboxylate ABC transporter permease [Thalassospira profundimaris]|uniref:TRAP transporter small permease protein n=1 Tax=Thalassospira profundimaris TaxID=502049 RepID=A0A367X9S4_9PROT|nr:TRAP transporter small permease subunit [Thalassospira profundimaris]RCK49860.1 C4-dicarboxylate ABC transporter permease [Thalassospira profundimaris]